MNTEYNSETVSNLFDRMLKNSTSIDKPAPFKKQTELRELWLNIASIGSCSKPLLLASGKLIVFCENAAWLFEVKSMEKNIRTFLAQNGFHITTFEVNNSIFDF